MRGLTALAMALAIGVAFGQAEAPTAAPRPSSKVAKMSPEIRESSGVVASRKYPEILWTHGDSGNGPKIFGVRRDGTLVGTCLIDATNRDWEDIAIDGEGHLYIADTGNNGRGNVKIAVYRVDEPDPAELGEGKPIPRLKLSGEWDLTYPGKPFDCESLFVYDGYGYVVSKMLDGSSATIYRFALTKQDGPTALEEVTQLDTAMPVTGADISPDGKRLAVVTPTGVAVFDLKDGVTSAGDTVPSRAWFIQPAMEACCFVPEGVVTTSEKGEIFLFAPEQFKKRGLATSNAP